VLLSKERKIPLTTQGRRQKTFCGREGQRKKDQKIAKKTQKNSTIKLLFSISIPCMKIQGRGARPPLPTPMLLRTTQCRVVSRAGLYGLGSDRLLETFWVEFEPNM